MIRQYLLIATLTMTITNFSSELNAQNPIVVMETEMGTLEIELFQDKAPVTVANFLEYVEKNMWKGASFYRVVRMDNQENNEIKIEVVQGGLGWADSLKRLPPIAHETTRQTGIKHTDGVISMARTEPGSADSEFFFCIGDQPDLDFGGKRNSDGQGFAAFGQTVSGIEILRKIQKKPDEDQMLKDVVLIRKVYRK